jgi:hypothetical protein
MRKNNKKKQGLWLAAGLVWCVVATIGMFVPFFTPLAEEQGFVVVGVSILWTMFACAVLEWITNRF